MGRIDKQYPSNPVMGVNPINVVVDSEDQTSRFAVIHQVAFFSVLISQFRSTVLFSRAHGKTPFVALTRRLTRGGSDRIRRSGRVAEGAPLLSLISVPRSSIVSPF